MSGRVLVRRGAALAAIAVLASLTSGCVSGSGAKATGGDGQGANKNTSKTVTILATGSQSRLDLYKAYLDPLLKPDGINLKIQNSPDFDTQINVKAQANDLPDIAIFPQPGILKQLASKGKLAPLDSVLDVAKLKGEVINGMFDVATVNGKTYGAPVKANVKSLVFYPKKAWDAAGYSVPKTLDELLTLSGKIKAEGKTPWCMGLESGAATGWVATDWIEELVLHYGGPQTYSDWVDHKVKFDSPVVKQAADYFQKIFATPGYVNGGRKSIAAVNFGTAGNPMFNTTPGCFMMKQSNFIIGKGFFPNQVVANTDGEVGVFSFPGVTAGDKSVEGSGDIAALFSGNNPSAKKVLQLMLSPDFCPDCMKEGDFNVFKSADTSKYPSKLSAQIAQIAYDANSFAFDGSDQMPGAVGSGSFWKQMVAWVNGSTTEEAALKAIDDSWPS